MAKVEGRNPVVEVIKGRRKVKKILLQKGAQGKKIAWIKKMTRQKGILVELVSKSELDKMADSHAHQGVIALVEKLKTVSPQEILQEAQRKGEAPFIVILDQIQDPHNLGSIIRTAFAAGAHGLIFQSRRTAGISPVVAKASAGAVEHLLLAEVSNINYAIDGLKEAGVWILGADLEGEQYYYQSNLKGPIGIVIGNEGKGLRRLVKEKCDFLTAIPLKGEIDSLNASVAAGIIFYEVVRQRARQDMA